MRRFSSAAENSRGQQLPPAASWPGVDVACPPLSFPLGLVVRKHSVSVIRMHCIGESQLPGTASVRAGPDFVPGKDPGRCAIWTFPVSRRAAELWLLSIGYIGPIAGVMELTSGRTEVHTTQTWRCNGYHVGYAGTRCLAVYCFSEVPPDFERCCTSEHWAPSLPSPKQSRSPLSFCAREQARSQEHDPGGYRVLYWPGTLLAERLFLGQVLHRRVRVQSERGRLDQGLAIWPSARMLDPSLMSMHP